MDLASCIFLKTPKRQTRYDKVQWHWVLHMMPFCSWILHLVVVTVFMTLRYMDGRLPPRFRQEQAIVSARRRRISFVHLRLMNLLLAFVFVLSLFLFLLLLLLLLFFLLLLLLLVVVVVVVVVICLRAVYVYVPFVCWLSMSSICIVFKRS